MNVFKSILVLAFAFLAVFGEATLSAPRTWLGAQIDLLPALMVYAALNTGLSTVAMILYPLFVTALGFTHVQSGIFLGGTIHDVAQVVGAGFSISPQTGDIATYVKLLRVTMLLPVVFTIAVVARRQAGQTGGSGPPVPLFLVGFAALVAANSLGLLAKPVVDGASVLSRWCLVTAIAALGMKTSFKALAAVGWKPVALMIAETLWIAGLVLASVLLLHPGA